jgi:hypothetical protein
MTLTVTMVGASFRPTEAKDIIKGLHIGDRVTLQADPDNEYDTTAVACYHSNEHIGFIPKESNSALFAMLMDGATLDGEIIAFESTLKPVLEIDMDNSESRFMPPPEEDMDRSWNHDDEG